MISASWPSSETETDFSPYSSSAVEEWESRSKIFAAGVGLARLPTSLASAEASGLGTLTRPEWDLLHLERRRTC